jgi:hypothetical protein
MGKTLRRAYELVQDVIASEVSRVVGTISGTLYGFAVAGNLIGHVLVSDDYQMRILDAQNSNERQTLEAKASDFDQGINLKTIFVPWEGFKHIDKALN